MNRNIYQLTIIINGITIMVQIKNQFLYLNMWKLCIDTTCFGRCGTPNIHIYTNYPVTRKTIKVGVGGYVIGLEGGVQRIRDGRVCGGNNNSYNNSSYTCPYRVGWT